MAETEIVERALAYLGHVYTARADTRQKELGVSYITAERTDLARQMAKFAEAEAKAAIKRSRAPEPADGWLPDGSWKP